MKLKDLENGMVVETREGNRYIVFDSFFSRNCGYLLKADYDENMKIINHYSLKKLDIMRVYKLRDPYIITDILYSADLTNELIWERKEVVEMTMEELREKLGYEVKIVEKK